MLYRNKKTGAVIETDCLISGGDWEPDRADAAPDATSEADTGADSPRCQVQAERQGDGMTYATVDDMSHPLEAQTEAEQARAGPLLEVISASLDVEARKVGKDLPALSLRTLHWLW